MENEKIDNLSGDKVTESALDKVPVPWLLEVNATPGLKSPHYQWQEIGGLQNFLESILNITIGTKMSKSLNNFYTVKELLGVGERQRMWRGESIRLMMLSTQYRQSLDFRVKGIENAKNKLDRWYRASALGSSSDVAPSIEFLEALRDDLNTPLAIAVLDSMCGRILGGDEGSTKCIEEFIAGARMLGLLQYEPGVWFQGASLETETREKTEIETLIEQRALAKKGKDFKTADDIRRILEEKGVIVEDKPGGETIWRWST